MRVGTVLEFLRARSDGALRDSLFYVGERLLTAIVNLAVVLVLTRSYSETKFGQWSYVLAIVQFATPFLAAGSEPIVVRELVTAEAGLGRILGSAAIVLAGTTLAANLVVLVYLAFTIADNSELMEIGLLGTLASFPTVMLILEHYFRSRARPGPIVFARLASSLTGGALKISLSLAGASLVAVAAVLPFEAAIIALGLIVAAKEAGPFGSTWRVDWTISRRLLMQCLPAMFSALAVTLFFRVNYLLLQWLADYRQVAVYSLAFSIVQTVMIIPSLSLSALFPRLVALAETNPDRYRRILQQLYFWGCLFGYCGVIAMATVGPALFRLVFGGKYADGAEALAWMFAAMIAMISGAVRAVVINIKMRQIYHLWSSLAGLAILVPVGLVLIPAFGAVGAAAGAVLGCFVSAMATSWFLPGLRETAKDQFWGACLLTPFVTTSSSGISPAPPAAE